MIYHTTNDSTGFSGNKNSFNVLNRYGVTDDRSQLQAWLSPLAAEAMTSGHSRVPLQHSNKAREFLGQAEEFRSRCELGGEDDDNTVLFCYRDPGVSKPFIR